MGRLLYCTGPVLPRPGKLEGRQETGRQEFSGFLLDMTMAQKQTGNIQRVWRKFTENGEKTVGILSGTATGKGSQRCQENDWANEKQ